MDMNATVKLKLIDPKIAANWLENKWGEQRTLRKIYVSRLSADMINGKFRLSPDAILRVKGQLANGQHRLSAVVESGIATTFVVMETDDEELYKVLDCGIKRSASDAICDFKFSSKMPAAARYIIAYQNGIITRGNRSASDAAYTSQQYGIFTQSSIVDFCRKNHDALIQSFEFCNHLYPSRKVIPLAQSAAIHFLASVSGKQPEIEDFITKVYAGFDRSGNDQINELIKRCEANSSSKSKLPAMYVFGLTIKCFNAVLKNQPLKTLRWIDGEQLPKI